METRLLLLTITYQQPACSILPHSSSWPHRNPSSYSSCASPNPNLSSRIRRICTTTRYRRRDANAEDVRTRRFSFNFRSGDDDDDDDDEDDDGDQASGILEEFIDSIYIFKSALSLAFEKLFGRTKNNPKRKSRRTKKKPSAYSASKAEKEEEQEERRGTRTGKTGYQTWVVGNDGSVEKGGQDAPNFGGWEELDKQMEHDMGSARKAGLKKGGSRTAPVENGRLSRRERKGNTPLLLRLLIAVFPILGSWTKFL
ncbi:hypothetical protein L1049_017151 [Liquidambar formosana]|uniref:Uncharacterized protein n=1 Tax=Liquidambar formosana TaxID=63359 RepID=A0AAP0S2S7_LIQFO